MSGSSDGILERIFENLIFKKSSCQTRKHEKLPSMERVEHFMLADRVVLKMFALDEPASLSTLLTM